MLLSLAVLIVFGLMLTENQVSSRVDLAVTEMANCLVMTSRNTEYCSNTSMGLRLYFYSESVKDFMEAPWFGNGAGGLSIPGIGNFPHNNNPHNEYLLLLSQQGIFGLLLWFGWSVLILLSVRKVDDPVSKSIIFAGLAMFATGCLFNSLFRDMTEGHAFILLVACALALSRTGKPILVDGNRESMMSTTPAKA